MRLARIRIALQLGIIVLITTQSTVFSAGPAPQALNLSTDRLAHLKSYQTLFVGSRRESTKTWPTAVAPEFGPHSAQASNQDRAP